MNAKAFCRFSRCPLGHPVAREWQPVHAKAFCRFSRLRFERACVRELRESLCVRAGFSKISVDIQLSAWRIGVQVDPVGWWPTHLPNPQQQQSQWACLLVVVG